MSSNVLNPASREEASRTLDKLGYLPLKESLEEQIARDVKPVGLGATESSPHAGEPLRPIEPQVAEADTIEPQREGYTPVPTELETRPPQPAQPQLERAPSGEEFEPRKPEPSKVPSSSPSRRRNQSRFPVYVAREDKDLRETDSARDTQERDRVEVEEAAVKRVLEYERKQGRNPEQKPKNYPGYDIESRDSAGKIVRYIEVKGLRDHWKVGGVALTDIQFREAKEQGSLYWLYVVECATQDHYKIYRIQDPANKANQFFYDDSWKQVAEEEET